jgi:2-phospho-L-lactate/phosphoenolpyruvate guanylyltransferase
VNADEPVGEAGWTVVVPVKPAAIGKSRLAGAAGGVDRASLARAIALDTIAAAARVTRVVVVTDDADVAAGARGIGAVVVAEGEARGLDAAVATGIGASGGGPRAALLGDLPALRSAGLAEALSRAAAHERAVVADAEGTGSTLVTARAGVAWASSFGDGSFARHLGLGCTPLDLPADSTLRRDVDTAGQLDAARRLGLGPRTTALLRGAEGSTAPPPTARLRLREMREDDLDDIAAMLGDPAVMTYYPAPRTRAESADWIAWSRRNYAAHGFGLWIVETLDGRFVGDCGLTWQPVGDGRRLEVGYHLVPSAQGRGYATEAATACRDLARDLGFTELIANIHPGNAASIAVAERLGLTFERDDVHPNGRATVAYSAAL